MRLVARLARTFWTTLAAVTVLSTAAVAVGIALRLSVPGAIGLYFVVWWTLLFAVLPVRVVSQAEAGEIVAGSEPGAPAEPQLYQKAVLTTIVAALVFVGVAIAFPLAGL